MNPVVMTETMDTQAAPRHRLCKLVQYMLGLDARGFGRPMTLVGVQVVFDGVRAAVIGIIAVIAVVAKSACKLTTRNIDRVRLLWVNLLVSAALTAITNSKFVWVLLGAVSFVFGSDLAIVTVFVLWRFKKTPEPFRPESSLPIPTARPGWVRPARAGTCSRPGPARRARGRRS